MTPEQIFVVVVASVPLALVFANKLRIDIAALAMAATLGLAQLAGWSTLREVRYAGSFEGLTTIAVGVRARVPFHVFTVLDSSGEYRSVVLDVAP